MNDCFFITENNSARNSGGNLLSAQSIILRRSLAIGDVLCSSIVADKLIERGYNVVFQAHPATHCVLRRHPLLERITDIAGHADIDLDGAYERDPSRRRKHFHQMFLETANQQLSRSGIYLGGAFNCRPRLVMPYNDKQAIRATLERFARPWVFICPRSESYNVRQVPDHIWQSAAEKIQGTKFWIGRHPAPSGLVDLRPQHFDHVVNWLSVADLMVSVDTGPMHVAAAFGVPVVAINQSSSPELHLSDQRDFVSVSPGLDCLNCQLNVCPKNSDMPPCQNVSPDLIASWANAKLRRLSHDGISAVVSIYKPEASVLNKCLQALLPQVDEIVVVSDSAGIVPTDAMKHSRIKYVRKELHNIGYGRKVNFGVRHTTHKWLVLINDDCFLDPEAVFRMKEVAKPGVGIVANLLRYPDGTIYHSGKVRSPGQAGWSHANYRQMHPYFSEPAEQENVCGCCLLMTRECFYDIGGFDEEYFLFAEDDDICLRARQAGWKIMFTPHSTGVHMEHQSVNKTGDIHELLTKANQTFDRKWGWYLRKNLNTVPGKFD